MIGELAALGAALVWAISSLLLKPLSTRFTPLALQSLRCLAAAIFLGAALLAMGAAGLLSQVPLWRAGALILATFIGIGIGESFFIAALRYIDVSRAYPIAMCGYPLVTILLVALFMGEKVTWGTLGGALLVVMGIYLIVLPKGKGILPFPLPSGKERRGILFVLLTMVAWGSATAIIRASLGGTNVLVANFLRISGVALLLLPLTFRQWVNFPFKHGKSSLALGALSGFLSFGLGGLLFLFGIAHAGAAKTSVLSATSPLFLAPLAIFFLKEKVTTKLILGVVLSVAGIVLIVA